MEKKRGGGIVERKGESGDMERDKSGNQRLF